MVQRLKKKISSKKAKIAVVGLGYVGLPLAVNFAKSGFDVLGLDKDEDRVGKVNKKISYISDIPTSVLRDVVKSGKFCASLDFDLLKERDVILVCVPTPLKRRYSPDVKFILSAVRTISKKIKRHTLVVLESTTYPGTTDELIRPELEKSGLKCGKDFFLSFSPERIDPGNKTYDVTKIPKVVGGLDETSTRLTQMLYRKIIQKIHTVSSAKSAEMTKLLENSFRIINIGWINEVAMMCQKMGIDVWEVIEAAKTKPFGFMPFYPGLGVGGHCIPDDPLYLYWKAKHHGFSSKYIKLSADTNHQMPAYVVERISDLLKAQKKKLEKSRILVLGVTYKKNVKDLRKSPAITLIEILQEKGAKVDYYDPIIPYLEIGKVHLQRLELDQKALSRYACTIIATDHSRVDYEAVLRFSKMVYDTRNVYKDRKSRKIFKI